MDRGKQHGQRAEALADPDAKHIHLQQPPVHETAGATVHEEVVEDAAEPGASGARQVAPHEDAGPGVLQVPGHGAGQREQDVDDRESMSEDVDRFVMNVAQAFQTSPDIQYRSISRCDIGVELKMRWHFTIG